MALAVVAELDAVGDDDGAAAVGMSKIPELELDGPSWELEPAAPEAARRSEEEPEVLAALIAARAWKRNRRTAHGRSHAESSQGLTSIPSSSKSGMGPEAQTASELQPKAFKRSRRARNSATSSQPESWLVSSSTLGLTADAIAAGRSNAVVPKLSIKGASSDEPRRTEAKRQ